MPRGISERKSMDVVKPHKINIYTKNPFKVKNYKIIITCLCDIYLVSDSRLPEKSLLIRSTKSEEPTLGSESTNCDDYISAKLLCCVEKRRASEHQASN